MNLNKLHNDIHEGALQLMAEHRTQLLSKARALCDSDDEADELVIRTIDQAIRKIDSYSGEGDILSWMAAILANIYNNDHRSPVVRGTKAVEADELERCAGADWSTDEQILRHSDSEAIRAAIAGLDQKHNKVLLMHYYEGLTLKEIANVLRLPLGTVSRRLQIAHHLLSGKLSAELGWMKRPLVVLAAVLSSVFIATAAVVWVATGAVSDEKTAVCEVGEARIPEDGDKESLKEPVMETQAKKSSVERTEAAVDDGTESRLGARSDEEFPNNQKGTQKMKKLMIPLMGAALCSAQPSIAADAIGSVGTGETEGVYQATPSAAIDNPENWVAKPSGVHRAPKSGDRLFVGLAAGDYLLRMSGADCRLENLNEFAGIVEGGVTSRVEVLNGAYLSTTNGFTLGAREGGLQTKSTLLLSGGKVDVGGAWFSGPHSNGSGKDSSSTIRIENGGELNLDRVTTTTADGDVAVLQPNGKEPLDFTISTGGVLRANYASGKHFICACSSKWRTGVKGGGDNFNFTLDGGQIIATNTTFDTQGAIVRVKGGSWYASAFRPTTSNSRNGKLLMSGGTMTLSSDLTLNYCGKEPVCLSGGSLRVPNLICQNEPRIVRISGGTFNVSYMVSFANGNNTGGRCWFKIIGSEADITVENVDKNNGSTTPVFWDYRFDSTARPGGPGVAPCKKTGYNKVVHGHYRISPYGGFQLVSTNVFPLVVQTAKRALEKGTTDGAKFATTYHDDLWDFPLPSGSSVLSAVLKEDAAIEDGKTLASGRVRGYLQLPPIRNTARCQGVTVRMNVVPQGTNTLEGIVAEIAEQYPGAARIEKDGCNVEVPLPLERLAPGDANKVVFDFSTIASVADAENGTVTTNALVTAIAAKVKKPGMILMFY